MGYRLFVPATTANLGPGFDVLGLALDLCLEIEARPAARWQVTHVGSGQNDLPQDESNLIVVACRQMLAQMGVEVDPQHLRVTNPIPVSRGMGSSATAIVGGMALAQLLGMGRLHLGELFQATAAFENHPDNVAPAVYGGLRICRKTENGYASEAGAVASALSVLLAIPHTPTSTKEMRDILPQRYSEQDLEKTQDLLKRLITALGVGDASGLVASQEDVLHQPYRLNVQPTSKQIFDIFCQSDALAGAFLSGSGPTIGGWVLGSDSPREILAEALRQSGISADLMVLKVDQRGVRFEVFEDEEVTSLSS